MIVKCENCHTAFKIEDALIKDAGTKLRCSQCKHTFTVFPPEKQAELSPPVEASPPPLPEADDRPVKEKPSEPLPESSPEVSEIRQSVREDKDEPVREMPSETVPESPPEVMEQPAPRKPLPEKSDSQPPGSEAKKAEEPKGKFTSFRTRLMYFAATLIGSVALIIIPIEIYRPVKELYHLIENGKNLVAGTRSAFKASDLSAMNEFAINIASKAPIEEDAQKNYFFLAFNILVSEGQILSEEEILKQLDSFEIFGGKKNFNYEALKDRARLWKLFFSEHPGILEIFRKYKRILLRSLENATEAGFDISSVYIMLDSGKKEGIFTDHILYVLDSYSWWEVSSYCGEPYQITPENEFWRKSALTGEVGYGHNPVFDPDNWYMPRFDEDEWGTWFSVWLTSEVGGNYNIFNIDFNARQVKRALLVVLGAVLGITILLFGMAFTIAHWYSGIVTKPIRALTQAAKEVAKGNYDIKLKIMHQDEIGEFTHRFNKMIKGQKERLNLKETLEKLLSKELADRAAEEGLMLKGDKADCTVMFTDFAGFSTLTMGMKAADAVAVLNDYFDGLIPIIKKYGGFPDKYIGDAIVAIFGAPVKQDNHAERAVACAIEMQWKMREINSRRRRAGETVFEMRIGLNSGEVLVGAIGCDQKLEYTTIGETTNLANRMESICDIGHVMIAHGTYEQIKSIFFKGVHIAVTPDLIQVKGYPEPVPAYRIYVDNREIAKNMDKADSLREFYSYKDVDHQLKYSTGEVEGVQFTDTADFMK